MQNGKLGAENLGKIFSEVSEISKNFDFSALLALLNSKALNQGPVSAVASMSKAHLSIHGKSTTYSSNSIYTTKSINLSPASPVPWQVSSFVTRPSSVLADMPEKLPKTSLSKAFFVRLFG